MKYTVMKCECCGKTFASEYWEGGYIDHVENFVGNRRVFVHRNDVNDMAREIIFSGNDLRELNTISDFLKCFMTWDCFPEEFKARVKKIVDAFIAKYKEANKKCKKLQNTLPPMVIAMISGEKIDASYYDAFDECCEESQ